MSKTAKSLYRCIAFGLLHLSSVLNAGATVTMPAVFGDHMVLQQGIKLPVWGFAAPGETVTVSIGSRGGRVAADSLGKWMLMLDPLPVDGRPQKMIISGTNRIIIEDVLIGDVWLCSGQSNMVFGLASAHNASVVIPKASHPQIRQFRVHTRIALEPQTDCQGTWVVCSPEVVGKGGADRFSAVAYFFGRELHEQYKRPIGLLQSCLGATAAQAWTSKEKLKSIPKLHHHADELSRFRTNVSRLEAEYKASALPRWREEHAAWEKQHGEAYAKAMKQYNELPLEARPSPPGSPFYQGPRPPREPVAPGANPNIPAVLFNGMINPIIPFGIKGAIWYQGESNARTEATASEYATLFPAMISDWRERWSQGDYLFLFVQLAGLRRGTFWPELRDSQMKALELPNTGMATAIDVGEETDIHPKNKAEVGHRLALAARHVAYGEDIVYSGPVYRSMRIEGDRIRLTFTQVGSGLTIGHPPPLRLGRKKEPPKDDLEGFAIAGSDGQYTKAQAKIDDNTVVVWSDQVPRPVSVRYAWEPYPIVNIYNMEGLPAPPFQTDEGGP